MNTESPVVLKSAADLPLTALTLAASEPLPDGGRIRVFRQRRPVDQSPTEPNQTRSFAWGDMASASARNIQPWPRGGLNE